MKIYVGITDSDWFNLIKADRATEVNFWQPSGKKDFKQLQPNEMFLFKQHKKNNVGGRICGGGFFVRACRLPFALAWEAFERKNGTKSYIELRDRIIEYRMKNDGDISYPEIGCIILTQPFFFDESDYIDSPSDWSDTIVSGKAYDTTSEIGQRLFQQVQERLARMNAAALLPSAPDATPPAHRMDTGAFRVLVSDSYNRTCAITGQDTFPALVATHIKPISEGGENLVKNGLLLRADLAALFSRGLITIDAATLKIKVNPRIRERYQNGKYYYQLEGHQITLPKIADDQPDRDLLAWHNNNVFAV